MEGTTKGAQLLDESGLADLALRSRLWLVLKARVAPTFQYYAVAGRSPPAFPAFVRRRNFDERSRDRSQSFTGTK